MDSFLQEMRINSFSFKVTIIHCLILWRKLSLSARYSPYTKFACCLYILTNASRHVNLSYYGGLRWRMGCEVRGRGEGCSWHRSVCVCVGMWTWQRHEMRKYTHQFHCLLEIVHHSSPWVVCFEARRCIYRPKGGLVGNTQQDLSFLGEWLNFHISFSRGSS